MDKSKGKQVRRKKNEGSIFQRKDNTWVGQITLGYDENGKRIRKYVYGHTKEQVAGEMSKYSGKIDEKTLNAMEVLEDKMKDWLLIFKKNSVTPRTFESCIRNFNLHIVPHIGKMRINEISPQILQQLYNKLFSQGLQSNTVRKVKFLLNQFFEYLIEFGIVEDNPVMRTRVKSYNNKAFSKEEDEYKALPPEIREKFLMALNDHEILKPICMTAMFAGLRIGEILALRWENIDFENKMIDVNKSLTIVPEFDENGKTIKTSIRIGHTKTVCSVRQVPIPDILIDALKDWKKIQWVNEQIKPVSLTSPKSFVFSNNKGELREYHAVRRMFARFIKSHKLSGYGIHFHTLRHTFSNMLLEMNENPKIVQGLLGHKSVKTTITTYNSVDKSYFQQATDKLNKKYNEETLAKEFEILKTKPNSPIYSPQAQQKIEQENEIEILEQMLRKKREELEKIKSENEVIEETSNEVDFDDEAEM